MNKILFQRYINTILRRVMMFVRKPLFLILASSLLVLWILFSKLSHIQQLQQTCNENIKSIDIKHMCPAQGKHVSDQQNSMKPKFWLAAKNPEGVHMEHVRSVFKYLGYERCDGKTESWDVMWAYEYPFHTYITGEKIKPHQLINHFPGMGYITSKVFLATSKFKYIPTAFSLPKEKGKFLEHANLHKDKLWVQKSNNHRGITIKSIDELDLSATHSFVQEYVNDPFLVDGRKFDIGIYTVITSIEPLRMYVYNGEWLVRYCAQDYFPFDVHNPEKYVVGDDYTPSWELASLGDIYKRLQFSHKNSLAYYINKKGFDFTKVQQDVYKAVAEITLEKKPEIQKALAKYPFGSNSFFEMVRFDFVFDSKLNVYLMEVNMSPNLSSAHFKPNGVMYEQVILNTLSLAGLSRATNERKSIDAAMVNDRDIQVYGNECQNCQSCYSDICKLCLTCLSDSTKEILKSAFREHLNKIQCVRVFPKPSSVQPGVSDDLKGLSEADKLMHLWYKGMCIKDPAWCL